MTKHTPGPWKITRRGVMARNPQTGRFNAVVCQPNWRGAEPEDVWLDTPREANARLIAAAPDMLDALKCIMQHGRIDNSETRMQLVASAIAKAEGGND